MPLRDLLAVSAPRPTSDESRAADYEVRAVDVLIVGAGETMAGVHGANRLGGNSLAETIAYGQVTGEAIATRLADGSRRSDADAARHDAAYELDYHQLE